MCRREREAVQGPRISRIRKGKGASGNGICQNHILTLCCMDVFVYRKAHCRQDFPAGFGGNRNVRGGTCSAHVACAFVFICAAEVYNIACSLYMSVRRCLCFMWTKQQRLKPVHYKCNKRSQKGEITSWAVWGEQ